MHVTIYTPSSITHFMPEKETCDLNFIWAFENLNFQVGLGDFQHTPNQACHTQK